MSVMSLAIEDMLSLPDDTPKNYQDWDTANWLGLRPIPIGHIDTNWSKIGMW